MKTTFNRIVAHKSPKKTVDKLVAFGFMHTKGSFKHGRSIDVIKMSHNFGCFLCIIDNDPTGQKCTLRAMQLDKDLFSDERHLYQHYNDLNDWIRHPGLSQKHKQLPEY